MRLLLGLAVLAVVALPASANLLDEVSGSFEDLDGVTGGAWPADGNGLVWQSTKTGGVLERDSTIWGPGAAACGAHYGSVQSGGGGTYYGWLQSITVPPSEVLTLTGQAAGGTLNAAADLWIQILDGCSDGAPVIGEWRRNQGTGGFGWTPFTIEDVHIASGGATIKFGITILAGWSDGTGLHLDCLDLVPEPGSLALFGLAVLPLLRRRR